MLWDLKNQAKPLEGYSKSRFEQIRCEVVSGTLWSPFFIDFGTTLGSLGESWAVSGTSGLDIDFRWDFL